VGIRGTNYVSAFFLQVSDPKIRGSKPARKQDSKEGRKVGGKDGRSEASKPASKPATHQPSSS